MKAAIVLVLCLFTHENKATDFGNHEDILKEAENYDGSGPLPEFVNKTLENKLLNVCMDNFCPPNAARLLAIPNFLYCSVCQALITKGIFMRKFLKLSPSTIADYFALLCRVAAISSPRVCDGVMQINIPIFVYMVDHDPTLTPKTFCSNIFQKSNCFVGEKLQKQNTCPKINLSSAPSSKPVKSVKATKATQGTTFQVVHISDQHVDDLYDSKSNNDCGEPQCCQSDQEAPSEPEKACGFWSDYKSSDCPWYLVEATSKQLKKHTTRSKWVYYTGDVLSHRVWETNRTHVKNVLARYYDTLKDTFGDVKVYPVLGNHDTSPLNQFAPLSGDVTDEFSSGWLYEFIAETWIDKLGWLPGTTKETLRKGGFYSVRPTPGLRVIALNNNVAYIYNWWVSFKDYQCDPYGQFQWLVKELDEAEFFGEAVHILGHVPSGDAETLASWANLYNKIIERYKSTVVLQLVGHTHYNQFYVQFDSNNSSQPIGFQMNGGSLTPFTKTNPSYQVYELNSDTFVAEDIVQYDFDLGEANSNYTSSALRVINWTKRAPFSELYGVSEVTPDELGSLLERMIYDRDLFTKYHDNKPAYAGVFLQEGCDEKCVQKFLCETGTSDSSSNYKCEEITNKLDRL